MDKGIAGIVEIGTIFRVWQEANPIRKKGVYSK